MPTKLKTPIVVTITHVENAIIALQYTHMFKPERTKESVWAGRTEAEVGRQILDALNSQDINWRTWEPTKPLLIGSHKAEVQPDGSVQIGCTRVDRETIKAVMKLSDEAVSKEPEWPKWYLEDDGDLYRFDGPSERGQLWQLGYRNWYPQKLWTLEDMQKTRIKPIPAAEAKSILKK